jgi:hypothetical protein
VHDRDFVAAFESCTLPGGEFHHRNHVRLAWIYLREPGDAETRFITNLQRYATSLGATSKYDDRITRTLLAIIANRAPSEFATFDEFMDANADLMDWRTLVPTSGHPRP